jgi:3-oxoacyl-[acyl-carrier protein] reductase
MMNFNGQVALITGGSRWIGAAIAKGFAHAGADVAVTYKSDRQSAIHCAKEIEDRAGKCLILRTSVSNPKQVRNAVEKTMSVYGRIDILVNNAGIWKSGKIGSMDLRQWNETIETNLTGTFLFCNQVVPIMKRQKSGKIINISSTAGQRGEPFYSHYAASKGGVIAFTKAIGAELAPFNINVNSVSPGWVETDMTRRVLGNASLRRAIDKATPRQKVAIPDDIVGSVLFLASDLSKHVIGATINVNGGSVLF